MRRFHHLFGLFFLCQLFAGCVGGVSRLVDDARVKVRIGVMANTEVGWITETKMLEKAFRFYLQNRVDAVVIAGKVTRNGYKDQFEVLDKVWRKVFAGQDVRLIAAAGRYTVGGFEFAVSETKPSGKCDILTFHGDGKPALTDELCYFPRDARVVCAGSMRGVDVAEGYADAARLSRLVSQAAQGLLVSVYEDAVRIRRLDFAAAAPLDPQRAAALRRSGEVYAEDLAEPWTLGDMDWKQPPPEFWDDTRIRVAQGYQKDESVYTVVWPSVQKRFTGARARSYVVEAAFAESPQTPFLRKNVLSEGFHRSEERDVAGVKCVFRASELPAATAAHGQVVFTITPIGAFGKTGRTFRSEPVALPPGKAGE